MEPDGRKRLPHEPPLFIDVSREMYFLTLCAQDRANAPLMVCAEKLLGALQFYHEQKKWWLRVAVIMPNHLHIVVAFDGMNGFHKMTRDWKHWTARQHGVRWQRDFFDHRLRTDESLREKSDYVLRNPERAGLVSDWREWPYKWIGDPQG